MARHPESRGYLVSERPVLLDGARGIGISCVVLCHVAMVPLTLEQVFWTQAWVAMFFVLSGFLLYHPFVAARYGGRRYSVRRFAWRRLMRIVPAAWVAILLAGLLFEYVRTTEDGLWLAALTFTHIYDSGTALNGLQQMWSLDVEVALYLLLGAWMAGQARRAPAPAARMLRAELAPVGLVMAVGVAWVAASHSEDPAQSALNIINPLSWIALFAAGMGLAVLVVHARTTGRPVALLRVAGRAPLLVWLAAGLVLVALVPVVHAALTPDGLVAEPLYWLVKHLLDIAFGILLLAPCVADQGRGGLVRSAFASSAAVGMSRISFGVFLWHFPLIAVLIDAGFEQRFGVVGLALATFALSVALGTLSYLLIERPAMDLSRRTTGPIDVLRRARWRASAPPPEIAAKRAGA